MDLTDDKCPFIEELLPSESRRGRPRKYARPKILNGIFYREKYAPARIVKRVGKVGGTDPSWSGHFTMQHFLQIFEIRRPSRTKK